MRVERKLTDAAVRRIVDEALACALQAGAESEETATNHSGPGGWYSGQGLADALRVRGEHVLDQVPFGAQAGGVGAVWQDDVVGALVHLPGHWAALRRAGSQLWFIDSLGGPILLAAADDPSTRAALRAYPAVFLVRTADPTIADRAGAVPQEARPGSMRAIGAVQLGALTVQARAQGAAEAADRMQGRVLDGRSNSPLALAVGLRLRYRLSVTQRLAKTRR